MSLIPVLLAISILTFLMIHLVPVDPAQAYLTLAKIPPTDEAIQHVREQLGLNKPLVVQYFMWLKNAVQLDFGSSYVESKPAMDILLYAFPATVQLSLAAVGRLILLSLPLGFLTAFYKDSFFDHVTRLISFVGASMPSFWLGYILVYFFSIKLGLFPVMGKGTILHLILPSLTLALGLIATYIRLLRASILENMHNQHVLYGRARGLQDYLIMLRHILRNALLPVVNAFGMSFGYMLAGSVIVENIFAWPGIGRLVTESIFNRDYPVIQCYVVVMALIFVFSNLLADVISALLDPRIRLGDE